MNTSAMCVLSTCLLSACLLAPADAREKKKAAPAPSAEQQAMMEAWEKAATPGAQHRQLAEHFVGTWNTQQTMWMDPSAPPTSETGQDVSTLEYGGRHVRTVFNGQFMGKPFQGGGLTSYDNVKGKYVASWVDSMATGQYLAEGDYDPATKTYTFHGQMPDPMKAGSVTPIRQVVRIADKDHHTMEWYENRDGKENKTMVIEYSRAP